MTDPVFFAPSRRISVSEIAELTGAKLVDGAIGDRLVTGIAPASEGGEGKLVFVEGKRNAGLLDRARRRRGALHQRSGGAGSAGDRRRWSRRSRNGRSRWSAG